MIIDPSNALAAPGSSRGYARLSVADGSIAASVTREPHPTQGSGRPPRPARGTGVPSPLVVEGAAGASGAAGVLGPWCPRPPKSRPRRRPSRSADRPRFPPQCGSEGKLVRSRADAPVPSGDAPSALAPPRRWSPSAGGGRPARREATGRVSPSRLRCPTVAGGRLGRGAPAPRGCLRCHRCCPCARGSCPAPSDRAAVRPFPRGPSGGAGSASGPVSGARAPSSPLGPRPQIGRGDPLNLSILVSGGKETNQDSLSNGE